MEVEARLSGRTAFLNGEALECQITFINKNRGKSKPKVYKLAWASAQIHCLCSVSESRVTVPKSLRCDSSSVQGVSTDTSFVPAKGERGIPVLSTPPSILFCDLTVLPDETCTFVYREIIPADAPPSFRGSAVKYAYKITIGIHIFGQATKLMRLPIRVLHTPGLRDIGLCLDLPEETKPSNPFEAPEEKKADVIEIAMEVLETLTTRRGPSNYNITNADGLVARFCLLKQAFKIGDDIIGVCNFAEASVRCAEFMVTLQSEEVIGEGCVRAGAQASTVTNHGTVHQFCLCMLQTNFTLPVPLTVTADFATDIVAYKWRLHFEFSTVRRGSELGVEVPVPEGLAFHAPAVLPVETLVWDLPINVYATNPLYVSSVSLLKMDATMAV